VLRLVENDPPPLPIPLAQVCGPDAAALAARWSAELGIAPADPDRQVGALEPAQRQIVALATACTAEPEVLLIDETTSTLDPARERRLLGLVRTRLPAAAIVAVLHRGDNVDLADVEITVRRASRGG
jgi:ABC-type sugar transport system ATPase subunit